jgi:hypothetical protein
MEYAWRNPPVETLKASTYLYVVDLTKLFYAVPYVSSFKTSPFLGEGGWSF